MNSITTLSYFFTQHPTLAMGIILLFGFILGSFINVVVARLPIMMKRQWYSECKALPQNVPFEDKYPQTFNLCFPRSHCLHCHKPVAAHHNIPLLSYLWLKGRCAECKTQIPWRYPLVEALTGLMLISLYAHFGYTVSFIGFACLGLGLIALSFIDLDEMLLPDQIVLPLIWLGLLFNLTTGFIALEDAVIGAVAGYILLWSVFWMFKLTTGKEGMGYGDFKLLAALGAWLGWQQLPLILFFSSVIGLVVSLSILSMRRQKLNQAVPFGPYLALAGWISLLFGEQALQWYLTSWI
tara:strand:- start:17607 stop:18491 length:885 start_codon:yes stop_codon:yes gene_type:complete